MGRPSLMPQLPTSFSLASLPRMTSYLATGFQLTWRVESCRRHCHSISQHHAPAGKLLEQDAARCFCQETKLSSYSVTSLTRALTLQILFCFRSTTALHFHDHFSQAAIEAFKASHGARSASLASSLLSQFSDEVHKFAPGNAMPYRIMDFASGQTKRSAVLEDNYSALYPRSPGQV